jgi:hypothetical protein
MDQRRGTRKKATVMVAFLIQFSTQNGQFAPQNEHIHGKSWVLSILFGILRVRIFVGGYPLIKEVRVLSPLLLSKKPFTDDIERFFAMLQFPSREKLKDLPIY